MQTSITNSQHYIIRPSSQRFTGEEFQLDYIFGKIEESYEIHRPYISIELHAFMVLGIYCLRKYLNWRRTLKSSYFLDTG